MSVLKKTINFFGVLGNKIELQYGLEDLKGIVGTLKNVGFDNLHKDYQDLIRFGVRHERISQKEVDELNDNYIKKRIPNFIENFGTDDLSFDSKKQLVYGLKKGLFTQKKIESAQEAYRTKSANDKLFLVRHYGLDFLSEESKTRLRYGVEKGLFTQEDIDKAQKEYLRKRIGCGS